MNHWDRLQAALNGEQIDCLPVTLWRFWPEYDEDVNGLARAVMAWQRRYDFDLVVFPVPDTSIAECMGAKASCRDDVYGRRTVERHAITSPAHWLQLKDGASLAAFVDDYNDGLQRTAAALGGTAPVLQSVSSPLTTAWYLAGDLLFEHIERAPQEVEAGLRIIAEVTSAIAQRAMAAGASGIRLASRRPTSEFLSREVADRFGREFDLQVLAAGYDKLTWHLLEITADREWFDTFCDYPVQILGWQDRAVGPDLRTGGDRFSHLLTGGLDANGVFGRGDRADVDRDVGTVVAGLDGVRAMLSTGGPCRVDTPEANIDGLIDVVRRNALMPKEEKGR